MARMAGSGWESAFSATLLRAFAKRSAHNRKVAQEKYQGRLNGFFDKSRAKAARAHADALRRAVDHGSHRLKIRVKYAFRLIVGVTHVMPSLAAFVAEITGIGHSPTPFSKLLKASSASSISLCSQNGAYATIRPFRLTSLARHRWVDRSVPYDLDKVSAP